MSGSPGASGRKFAERAVRGAALAGLAATALFAQETPPPCSIDQWKEYARGRAPVLGCDPAGVVNADLGYGRRALHWAIGKQRWDLARTILGIEGIDAGLSDDDDVTPLHILLLNHQFPTDLVERIAKKSEAFEDQIVRFVELYLLARTEKGHAALREEVFAKLDLISSLVPLGVGEAFHGALVRRFIDFERASPEVGTHAGDNCILAYLQRYDPKMSVAQRRGIEYEFRPAAEAELALRLTTPRVPDAGLLSSMLHFPSLDRPYPSDPREQAKYYLARVWETIELGDAALLRFLVNERGVPLNEESPGGYWPIWFLALSSKNPLLAAQLVTWPEFKVPTETTMYHGREKTFLELAVDNVSVPLAFGALLFQLQKRGELNQAWENPKTKHTLKQYIEGEIRILEKQMGKNDSHSTYIKIERLRKIVPIVSGFDT